MDAIPALHEVFDGVNDWESCANVGLEAVLGVLRPGEGLQPFVPTLRIGRGDFVGRHHTDGCLKHFLVDAGHMGARGVVHKRSVFQVHGLHRRHKRLQAP